MGSNLQKPGTEMFIFMYNSGKVKSPETLC